MINGMRPVQDENGAITVDGVKYRNGAFLRGRTYVLYSALSVPDSPE